MSKGMEWINLAQNRGRWRIIRLSKMRSWRTVILTGLWHMDLDNGRYCPSVLPHLLRSIVVYMLLLKILIILMKTRTICQRFPFYFFLLHLFCFIWNCSSAIKYNMVTCLQYWYFDIQSMLSMVGTLGNRNLYLSHQTRIDASSPSRPHYS